MNSMNSGLKSANNNNANRNSEALSNGLKILGLSALGGSLVYCLGFEKGKSKKKKKK